MANISLRISETALKRFQILHEKSGLKNKGQTFEALLFQGGEAKDSIFEMLKIMDTKINTIVE